MVHLGVELLLELGGILSMLLGHLRYCFLVFLCLFGDLLLVHLFKLGHLLKMLYPAVDQLLCLFLQASLLCSNDLFEFKLLLLLIDLHSGKVLLEHQAVLDMHPSKVAVSIVQLNYPCIQVLFFS